MCYTKRTKNNSFLSKEVLLMVCPQCGQRLNSKMNFCSECGAKINLSVSSTSNLKQNNSKCRSGLLWKIAESFFLLDKQH